MDLSKYKEIFREFAGDADLISEKIDLLKLDKESKILDIGTGLGAMSILLALKGFKVLTGEPEEDHEKHELGHDHSHHSGASHDKDHTPFNDYDWESWDNWNQSAKVLGVDNKIVYQHFDAQDLPFEDGLFDGIFLYDSLQHIENRERTLKECLRVLKESGVIIVIEWTEKQIEEDYKKYGFKIEKIDPSDYLNQKLNTIEKVSGDVVNFYIIRRI
ncbi:MAG: class I SAM-dependent methyltransferase [Promethearchaeota archaeon]